MLEDIDKLMEESGIDTFLAVGNAFETPDIFWLTDFRSPDNIFYFKNLNEESIIATAFNTLNRVEKESKVKKTYDLTSVYQNLMREGKRVTDNPDIVFDNILRNLFTGKTLGLPNHIPANYLIAIQQLGYEVKVVPDLILDARATKSTQEIKMIQKAAETTVAAISHVIEIIKDSSVGANKTLMRNGRNLTVGDIKLALEHFLLDRMAECAEDTIVAVGQKSFDWHYLGNFDDVLKSEVPIIIDVFPRLKIDRYIGDVTRTVIKGKVSPLFRNMFEAAYASAEASIDTLSDNVKIDDVNLACFKSLERDGFQSRRLHPDTVDGMTHGLGHGIGLEVHEKPSMYTRDNLFMENHTVAIEPGIYIKGSGGIRIENDYAVTKGKAKRLSPGLDEMLFI